jgi:hypothetical protein
MIDCIRTLHRAAVFPLVASAYLAIGIAAAVGFTVRPVPDPEGVYRVSTDAGRRRQAPDRGVSYAAYLELTRYGPFAHLSAGFNRTLAVKVAPGGARSPHCPLRHD